MDNEQYQDVPFGGDGTLAPEITDTFIEKGILMDWTTYDEGPSVKQVSKGNNLALLNFDKH